MNLQRIADPSPADLRDDAATLLAALAPPGRRPARTMALLARSPDLLAPVVGWAAALALSGTLNKRQHEIVALRAASRCGSDYEWAEHVAYARDAGLDADEIEAIAADTTGKWSRADAALLRATDDLVMRHGMSDATWAELSANFETSEIVEVLFVAGQYTMLSMVANAAHLQPPDAPTT